MSKGNGGASPCRHGITTLSGTYVYTTERTDYNFRQVWFSFCVNPIKVYALSARINTKQRKENHFAWKKTRTQERSRGYSTYTGYLQQHNYYDHRPKRKHCCLGERGYDFYRFTEVNTFCCTTNSGSMRAQSNGSRHETRGG